MVVYNKEYQMAEVERICEIKRVRLQTWLSNGWITPSIQKASGHGTRNVFSESDLYKIAFFKRAIESGISRSAAAQFVPGIEEILEHERNILESNLEAISRFKKEQAKRVKEGKERRTYLAVSDEKVSGCIFFRRGGEVVDSKLFPSGMSMLDNYVYEKTNDWDDAIILNFLPIMEEIRSRL
jgi:DNA-binding transcriptional MerR regulator